MILKNPKECGSLEEIRSEIDKIDRQIIDYFAKRDEYISEIMNYKNDLTGVIAFDRKNLVIRQRGEWAAEKGLCAETFEKMYSLLVETNIRNEINMLKKKQLKEK